MDAAGNLFIADSLNQRLRMVDKNGKISTVAGTGRSGRTGENGPAASLQLSSPSRVIVDRKGNLYISDRVNNRVLKLTLQTDPGPQISGTPLNAASFAPEIAPGALVLIQGSDLATSSADAAGAPWPVTLGGATVTVNGVAAPIYSASPAQLAIQVPYEVSPGPATITVTRAGLSVTHSCTVAPAAPGLFPAVENEDGSPHAPGSPAAPGGILNIHMTGIGLPDVPVPTGAAALDDPPSRPLLPSAVTIGDQPCEIVWFGLTAGQVGVAHASVRVPELEAGEYPLVVTVGDAQSRALTVYVQPAP